MTKEDLNHFHPDTKSILDYIIHPQSCKHRALFEQYYCAELADSDQDGRFKVLFGLKQLYADLGSIDAVLEYLEQRKDKISKLVDTLLEPNSFPNQSKKTAPNFSKTLKSQIWDSPQNRLVRLENLFSKI